MDTIRKNRHPAVEAYLDIETTGLSPDYNIVTVIGIYLVNGTDARFVQLVGEAVTRDKLLHALERVEVIYTYNGSRFDLPFINSALGLDLTRYFRHQDLMYNCWKRSLYGGLKAVERQLGIDRRLKDMNGHQAVRLWHQYKYDHDRNALITLLEYNREDVINLKELRQMLCA